MNLAKSRKAQVAKRIFDIVFSLIGLLCFGWLVCLAALLARIDTGKNGIFRQERIGREGRVFKINKIRTMIEQQSLITTVTVVDDPRITQLGKLFRKSKIDELPQLWNILVGEMSFVGPRPDVRGFADALEGRERLILAVRPGITGVASIKFRNEERLLLKADNPEAFNKAVIFPEKVRLNLDYIENYHFTTDIRIILRTVLGGDSVDFIDFE